MSGLTSYYYYEDRVITPATHQYRVYHADEADKVIAELQAMLEEHNKQEESIRHHKYKRCLAMAKWCDAQVEWYNSLNEDYSFWLELYVKWHNCWLELAERFKEAEEY